MAAMKKFYGVKVGRAKGIYQTWAECRAQVHGYPGALYKGFATEREALSYIDDDHQAATVQKPAAAGMPPGVGKYYDIYVDGSYANQRYSWAFAVYDGARLIHTASGLGQDVAAAAIHNVAGELEAAMQAMKWSEGQAVDFVILHHDYIGISEWATGRWKTNNQFTKAYADFAANYLSRVKFNKVAGHSGVEGNELADKLAGQVLKDS
ncbi:viroplasmin family protein|uniref:ribonuclease H n=1 Tax=Dendrosporobacter quercicolus TaxID=146817 RepID=A0A1G9LV14_9FIRM|nr:ribonuclease H family protein [Dendrosporobacter quercicolus]NSL46832.1 viroplasmin family protein [Dendrosporobacter quercicolus DSM 1736]SDL65577.1 ribonuclease HI [Dendrosporobacter quercicolus]